jgi:hypothetical protein
MDEMPLVSPYQDALCAQARAMLARCIASSPSAVGVLNRLRHIEFYQHQIRHICRPLTSATRAALE